MTHDSHDHLRESADQARADAARRRQPHVLVVLPDGHAILTTTEVLSPQAREELVLLLQVWKDTPDAIAVMDGVEVVKVVSVDLDEATVPA